ncbi:hypothetical protein HH311_00875 [Actinomycetospora sp. TBRC 11914]|nr:hypothetical protein [Actinomycetospora sp. TBRC 11914]
MGGDPAVSDLVWSDGQVRVEVEGALAREYRFQAALSQALVGESPEHGIAEVLHDHLGLGVAVEDPFGRVLAQAGPDGAATQPRLTRAQRDHLIDAARRVAGPLRVRDRLASLAVSRGTLLGLILVQDPEHTLEPADKKDPDTDARPGSPRAGALHAIGLATGALSLHLLHRHHLARTELRLRHDLVETVLLECDPDDLDAEIERRIGRASALSHDLTGPHRVLAVHPRHGRWPGDQAVGDLMEHAARTLDMSFLGTLRGQTAILVCGPPAAWLAGSGTALAPWTGEPTTTTHAATGTATPGTGTGTGSATDAPGSGTPWQLVHDAFTHVLHDAPAVGVGGYVDRPEHLPRSYREAMQALTVRTRQPDPTGLIAFEDLGLYRLLATPDGRRQAGAFVQDWIGHLLAYDNDRRAGLVHTLGIYLDHGGNYDATAAALHIHRSTLRYRLQRIRELTGHDLTDTDTRLNLHVAVRAAVIAEPPLLPAAEYVPPL